MKNKGILKKVKKHIEIPSKEELNMMIFSLKHNKAFGKDLVVAELIKCSSSQIKELIHKLLICPKIQKVQ